MDIDVPLKDLGPIAIDALKEAILSIDELTWKLQSFRQGEDGVHQQTKSIVLVFTDGESWPNIEVSKESGWDLLAETAIPVMHLSVIRI